MGTEMNKESGATATTASSSPASLQKRRLPKGELQLTMFESLNAVQVIVALMAILHLGLCVYVFGGVFSQLKFQREFTGWATPPPPGQRIMASWSHYWYFYPIMVLLLNAIVSPFCFFALNNVYSRIRIDVARLVAGLVLLVTALSFVALCLMWFLFSNSQYFPFNPASSDDYCLAYYGSVAASGHCRNVADAVGRPSAAIVLGINEIFKQLFAATIFLGILLIAQELALDSLRNYAASVASTGIPDRAYLRFRNAVRSTPKVLRWIMTVVIIVYVLVLLAYFLTGPLILDLRHTTQFPATGPIGTQSARTAFTLAGLVCLATAILVPVLAVFSIRVIGKRGYTQVVIALLLVLMALHCFGLMTVAQARSNANKPGQPNNPGNSEHYCCVPEIYNDPASQCDNAIPCPGGPTTIDQLRVNDPHTTIFAMAFVFIGLDVGVIILVYLIGLWNSSVAKNLPGAAVRTVEAADALISQQVPDKLAAAAAATTPDKHADVMAQIAKAPVIRQQAFQQTDKRHPVSDVDTEK
jgi:hypothetical protein